MSFLVMMTELFWEIMVANGRFSSSLTKFGEFDLFLPESKQI